MIEIVFSILSVIFLIGIVVALIIITRKKLGKFTFVQQDIPHFSKDVEFEPYPEVINIENQHDCNVNSLRPCKIDDSSTLFGCKELLVRCHHFEKDTEFVENNRKITIPQNKSKNEGYALAITSIATACNAYHGDLILVSANNNSSEYMLICNCKNPGYIGNETILGNCTTPFICNGMIDNIDQPLNKINCICSTKEYSARYQDGLPVCKELTVYEANKRFDDWTSLVSFQSNRQLDIEKFNKTVAGNLNVKRLLNPCTNSLHDSSVAIHQGTINIRTNECSVSDISGIPLDVGMLNFNRSKGFVGASAVLSTGPINYVRFSDKLAGQRRLMALSVQSLNFYPYNKNIVVALTPGMTIGASRTVAFRTKDAIKVPSCYGAWPTYKCDAFDIKHGNTVGGLVVAYGRDIPSSFLWKKQEWIDIEGMMSNSFDYTLKDGYSMMPSKLAEYEQFKAYGVRWVPERQSDNSTLLSFLNFEDFKVHKNTLT